MLRILCILCIVHPNAEGRHIAGLQDSFILSQADGRPMYRQIMDQVQRRVAVGDWPPGTKLPSIRELAVALKVSVITVKRAYLELERSAVIVTQQGKGSWVNTVIDRSALQMDELARHLDKAVLLASSLRLSPEELVTLLENCMRQRNES